MSHPEEQLSTRDLASSSAEPRDEPQAAEDREGRETSARYDGTTTAGEPTPAAPATEESDPYRGDRDADVAEPASEAPAAVAEPSAEPARDGDEAPLLGEDEGAELGSRWESIQVTFVDDPRRAVEEADGLVAHVMQQLADGFARERENLEGQWSRGEDVSTEDLRVALQRYRSFFQRLLSA
jgi:hypothetical protein